MDRESKDRFDNLDKRMDDIQNNHLPHIYETLGKCMGRMKILTPLNVGILVGVVLLIIGVALQICLGG